MGATCRRDSGADARAGRWQPAQVASAGCAADARRHHRGEVLAVPSVSARRARCVARDPVPGAQACRPRQEPARRPVSDARYRGRCRLHAWCHSLIRSHRSSTGDPRDARGGAGARSCRPQPARRRSRRPRVHSRSQHRAGARRAPSCVRPRTRTSRRCSRRVCARGRVATPSRATRRRSALVRRSSRSPALGPVHK